MKIKDVLLFTITCAFVITSCNKQLEVNAPIYTTNEATIYASDATAVSVLAGIYIRLSGSILWSLSIYPSLSADELTPYSGITQSNIASTYYTNNLNANTIADYDYWSTLYPLIYFSNSAVEGLSKSKTLSPSVKKQLLGEAHFIRAFCYFYLVNLYGDVPLITGTDYSYNRLLARSPQNEVWNLIIADLIEAQNLLSDEFLDGSVLQTSMERIRPTKWAATALLARAYLYLGNYANAEAEATKIINETTRFDLTSNNEVFLKNSNEAIWQLQPIATGQNTVDARWFVIPTTGFSASRPFHLSDTLINQFELGDLRKTKWINMVLLDGKNYYYPYKYKVYLSNQPVTEYTMVIRLGEQYLIRAEARIKQNNVSNGVADLNVIRARSRDTTSANIPNPLPNLSLHLTNDQALQAVYHERQVELFTEWGHRWLDLKRTKLVDLVMGNVTPKKGGVWNSNWAYYPVQIREVERAPNLTQTPGYK